jgi:gamma-glutamylaminecyclotransferase
MAVGTGWRRHIVSRRAGDSLPAMLHRIFVYGTLKQGFPNFHINRGRRVPGSFVTAQRYPMFILGDARLPWLVQQPGVGHAVAGELYEVDDAGLAAMDVLEQIDEPGWYHRETIAVHAAEGGEAVQTFVYFGTAPRVALETVHAGPLAVYTAEHAKTYREDS